MAAYHESQLAALVERVGAAIDRFRDGELDGFGVDQVLFQYSAGGEGTVEILQPWGSRADSEHHARAAGGRLVGAWCASEALRPSAHGFSRTHVDVGMASGGGLTQLLAPARGEVTLMAAAVWFPPSRSGWT